MKIAIYHPNLKVFGGGETVALTIAESLSKENTVDVLTHYDIDKEKLENFFKLDLSKVNIKKHGSFISNVPTFNSLKYGLLLRSSYKKLEKYDLVIDTATNGWFDKKLKTKTICYIHYPYFQKRKKGIKSILNHFLIKPENAFCYDIVFCNSNFTKKIVCELTSKKIEVLNPPVEVKKIKSGKKEKRIVTIGRFTYDKKHEVMIDAFKKLSKKVKGYKLDLIGSFQEDSQLYKKEYFEMLKKKAEGYPIKFHVNMPHDEVLHFLEESKIYWHARGYGETDLNEYENFGITTVEAMAAGCVPIVINLGAQPEIVQNKKNGYIWDTPNDLINLTLELIKDSGKIEKISLSAIKKSKSYDSENFINGIKKAISSLF